MKLSSLIFVSLIFITLWQKMPANPYIHSSFLPHNRIPCLSAGNMEIQTANLIFQLPLLAGCGPVANFFFFF